MPVCFLSVHIWAMGVVVSDPSWGLLWVGFDISGDFVSCLPGIVSFESYAICYSPVCFAMSFCYLHWISHLNRLCDNGVLMFVDMFISANVG